MFGLVIFTSSIVLLVDDFQYHCFRKGESKINKRYILGSVGCWLQGLDLITGSGYVIYIFTMWLKLSFKEDKSFKGLCTQWAIVWWRDLHRVLGTVPLCTGGTTKGKKNLWWKQSFLSSQKMFILWSLGGLSLNCPFKLKGANQVKKCQHQSANNVALGQMHH